MNKPNIIYLPAHSTNTWSRMGTQFLYIVMHYVGAVSTARNNGTYYGTTPNIGASAHFFVDEHDIVASVPLTMAAGHCGVDYSNGKAPYWHGKGQYSTNRQSIGIEMCCKKRKDGSWYIEPETVERVIPLVKWLMQEFQIPAANVIRHYDVTWKNCPAPWVEHPEQWTSFKHRIEDEEEMKRYKTVEELPAWARADIQTLIDNGKLQGKGGDLGLDLTEDMVRTLIVCGRMTGVLE